MPDNSTPLRAKNRALRCGIVHIVYSPIMGGKVRYDMKKLNIYDATRNFSEEVAMYTVKSLWRKEYKEHLAAALEKDAESIKGLENCKGSAIMTDDQVDELIAEKVAHMEDLKTSYDEVITFWTAVKPAEAVKDAYKKYVSGNSAEGFITMMKVWAKVDVDADTDIVKILCDAVLGDSGRDNTTQLINTGVASVELRSKTEFTKIVYRRLFDFCVEKGTIRFVGNVVKGAGEDVAELLVETPKMIKAKALKKVKKSKKSAK